jgi:2-iminobutanoate/2-iminopropanoate deaminase
VAGVTDRERDWLAKGLEPTKVGIAGDLFLTSGMVGIDAATGQLPSRPQDQFAMAYANLAREIEAHGIGLEAIGLLTVSIPTRTLRAYIDPPWLDLFPSEAERPARKTNEVALPEGLLVQLQATGVRGSRCTSVGISGLRHRAPIPLGAKVGTTVFSSVLGGDDPATGQMVPGAAAQTSQAFANAVRLMEQTGGGTESINHVWAFMGDMRDAPLMLKSYLANFPDATSRPARKTVPYALPDNLAIQLQVTGDIGGRTRNFDLPGIAHHDPIPLASLAGRLLQSSGIYGIDAATGRMVDGGLVPQTRTSLDIIERLMAEAGRSLAAVAGLTILLDDFACAPWLASAVEQRFGAGRAPALRFIPYPLPDGLAVQFHVTAWI